MRPTGRHQTESLYFTYPHFEAPTPDLRAERDDAAPVVIVGAGPVGMVAALTLAREGVRSILVDAKSTFNDGSRAICIARQSFHILRSLGAVEPFLEKSLPWTTGRSYYRGERILEFTMPDGPGEKFRPMYNLQQQYIEQYLWEAIDRDPLIDVRWQSEVTGIADTDGGATVTIRDPHGQYTLHAQWVLAADGARSAIRRMRGLRLRGENYEGRYVIADIRMAIDYPTIRRALFDPSSRPGGTVLVHRQPDDIWRIDYQLRDGENEAQALAEENVRASVSAVLADLGHEGEWELEWWSVYSANTLALDDYRDGRVFFIGDSAHIVPIFGVRGLNNGLADAQNIGWKLAYLLTGRAGEAILDSYTPERRGATLDVFANATKSARFMTPPTKGWRVMRDAALALAKRHAFAGELANPRQMTPFTYAGSPGVLPDDPGFATGPVVGAAMPDCLMAEGHLSDRLGARFTVICFDDALANSLRDRAEGPAVICLPADGETACLLGATGASAYLVRPDLHIGARWRTAGTDAILNAIATLTFRSESQ